MKGKNIILAGVARSGSTLVCHILNKTKNTVALHEPIQPKMVPISSHKESVQYIEDFFLEQRNLILHSGIASSSSMDGMVPDNHVGDYDYKTGKRAVLLDGNEITIDKSLENNFSLVIKQPGLFTGMLGFLSSNFPCFATIRNPLAVLCSWNSVDMAVTSGHAPAAENCDSNLKFVLEREQDVFNRQLILLSWYFEQYYNYLEEEQVIRYEEVIHTGGRSLSSIDPSMAEFNEVLSSKNNNRLYDNTLKLYLAECLLNSDGFYWKYYSKQDVRELLIS